MDSLKIKLFFEDTLIRNYLTKNRTADADAARKARLRIHPAEEEDDELAAFAEWEDLLRSLRNLLEQNKGIVENIISEMHNRLTDLSFHSPDDFREDLKSAMIRISSYTKVGDVHPRTATPEDRTRRFRMEHDRIHNMFRSMNPDSAVGDFDLDVSCEGFIFNSHKQILSSHSGFFAQQVEEHGQEQPMRVQLNESDIDTSMIFFRYMYTNQLYPVSLENLVHLTKAAAYLSIKEISIRCSKMFMEIELFRDLLQEWVYIKASTSEKKLIIQDLFDNDMFVYTSTELSLYAVTYNLNLTVERETDVCDLILDWLDKHEECKEESYKQVMGCVTWSLVPEAYVRSEFLYHKKLKRMPVVLRFIIWLLDSYYRHRILIQMQRTFIRSSFGYEKCFVGVEKDEYGKFNVTMRRLQGHLCRSYVNASGAGKFEVELNDSISGAVYHEYSQGNNGWQRDTLYLTGTGKRFKGILKYDISTGWSKCSDMVTDRKYHRSVFVGSKLYSCGGVARCTIEEFDINSNTSKTRSTELLLLTDVGCVVFRKYIFFFGGSHRGVSSDYVQRFDTETDILQAFYPRMLLALAGLVPVVCGDVIILLHEKTCVTHDVRTVDWTVEKDCRTNFSHFAAVLEDDKIFTFGGTANPASGRSRDHAFVQFIDTEEVVPLVAAKGGSKKKSPAPPIVKAEWKWCGNLNPPPIHYLAYGTMTVPCEKFKDGSWTWISQ